MTISEIKTKIVEWVKTGIPSNIKSSNMRALLAGLAIRQDVQEVGRLKIIKTTGNSAEVLEVNDRVTAIVEDTLIINAIYLGGDQNLLSSYYVNNPVTFEDIYQNDRIISSAFTWDGNYDYTVIFVEWVKNSLVQTIIFNEPITLDAADPTDDRLDAIVFNMTSETVYKKTGTPALATLDDDEYIITIVPVNAGTTEPTGATTEDAYKENLQEVGGEYDTSASNASVDPDDTTAPITGAKSIRYNASGVGHYLDLIHSVQKIQADYSQLTLKIKLENSVNHNIRVSLRDAAGNIRGTFVTINNVSSYGFNRFDTVNVQTVVIPITNFDATLTSDFYRIRIENRTNGSSYYIDDVILVSGIGDSVNLDDYLPRGGYSGTAQDLKDLIDAIGSSPGVITVTGPTVDNTDPDNPIVNLPALADLDTVVTGAQLDDIQTKVNGLDQSLVLKGNWDASSGSFPGGGVAQAGWYYIVNVAGTVDSVEFGVNDRILAIVDNASTATFAVNWNHNDESTFAAEVNNAAAKTTPVDADLIGILDSAASFITKKLTWANLKATLKTYFDTLYNLYVHPNHSGDVTSVADGATTIANNVVSNAKLTTVATQTFKGRTTAATGNVEDLTVAQVKTMLFDRLEEDATVTGTKNIDWTAYETFRYTLTGACTFSDTNLPATGTKTITIHMDGNFAPTYPAGWTTYIRGAYDGAVRNLITVEYVKAGTPFYVVDISQPD